MTCWRSILVVFLIICLRQLVSAVVVKKILSTKVEGCVAKVQTDTVDKWIYLKDDYHLVEDSWYSYTDEAYGVTFLWRPCVAFDVKLSHEVPAFDNTCHDTNVALEHHNRSCSSLGKTSQFTVRDGSLQLHYNFTDDPKHSAAVKLVCNDTVEKGQLVCVKDCGLNTPTLQFTSKYVCLSNKPVSRFPLIPNHNLSTGSLLLIITSFILMTYLLVGVIRGTLKGRSGCDRLPNSDFWLELPLLVRDGCRFTFTCRTPRPFRRRRKGRSEIYQPIIYDNQTPVVDV